MVNYLTVGQLYDACQKHRYILLRFSSGYQMGVNCGIAKIAQKLKPKKRSSLTDFISYKSCNIEEYIQHKHPYYTKK